MLVIISYKLLPYSSIFGFGICWRSSIEFTLFLSLSLSTKFFCCCLCNAEQQKEREQESLVQRQQDLFFSSSVCLCVSFFFFPSQFDWIRNINIKWSFLLDFGQKGNWPSLNCFIFCLSYCYYYLLLLFIVCSQFLFWFPFACMYSVRISFYSILSVECILLLYDFICCTLYIVQTHTYSTFFSQVYCHFNKTISNEMEEKKKKKKEQNITKYDAIIQRDTQLNSV